MVRILRGTLTVEHMLNEQDEVRVEGGTTLPLGLKGSMREVSSLVFLRLSCAEWMILALEEYREEYVCQNESCLEVESLSALSVLPIRKVLEPLVSKRPHVWVAAGGGQVGIIVEGTACPQWLANSSQDSVSRHLG